MGVKIIAEIGVNHNGSVELSKELIRAARDAGADAVKFQTFKATNLAGKATPKVPYQLRPGDPIESHLEMLQKLELSREDHRILKEYCDKGGIEFCSTPYSRDDAEFLEELGVSFFKTASADIVDRPLHEFLSTTGKECILATGMATLGEIEETVRIYDERGNRDNLILLQCVSAYPADPADMNLRMMGTLREAFKCRVGLSDHTDSPFCAIAAAALGASIIEKHFTLDKTMPGPDHAASSTPEEFSVLVDGVRTVEKALGDGVKRVCPSELDMRNVSRKSIVAARALPEGWELTHGDLTLRRPGTGISPMRIHEVIGKRTRRALSEGEIIHPEDFA